MHDAVPNNSKEWRELILRRLDKLENCVVDIKVAVSALNVKSGVWGVIGGMIPVAIIIILWLLRR